MVNIERIKELINDPSLSDEEIKIIRDELYTLTEIIYEYWQKDKMNWGNCVINAPLDSIDNETLL